MSLGATIGDSPARGTEVVTTGALASDYVPKDAAGNPVTARGFSIGTAGAVVIVDPAGQTSTIPQANLATGVVHPIEFTKIVASGTTAQSIVAHG